MLWRGLIMARNGGFCLGGYLIKNKARQKRMVFMKNTGRGSLLSSETTLGRDALARQVSLSARPRAVLRSIHWHGKINNSGFAKCLVFMIKWGCFAACFAGVFTRPQSRPQSRPRIGAVITATITAVLQGCNHGHNHNHNHGHNHGNGYTATLGGYRH